MSERKEPNDGKDGKDGKKPDAPPLDSTIPQGLTDMRITGGAIKKEDDKSKGGFQFLGKKVVVKANGRIYHMERVIGHGSFGVVFQASVVGTGEVVAIKKVLQDKRFKNRELQIMTLLDHPNVVRFIDSFFTNGDRADEIFLNLVLEYVPETVYRVSRYYSKLKQSIPLIYVKLYMYQLCRALSYIHSLGICHRDIKPQNLLLDPQSGVLKLCDFGSAKILIKGEPNTAYICSRYYRAPELIFGSTTYTTEIDIWSMGCVMAELLLGQPLFPGDSGVDQLVEIIKVLGTPTREQIHAMNQHYTEFRFPQIKGHSWTKVFRNRTPTEAIDLIAFLLQYTPGQRIKPIDACIHPFFDDLRDPLTVLPNQRPLPPLFNFTQAELTAARHIPRDALIPPAFSTSSSSSSSSSTTPTPTPTPTSSTPSAAAPSSSTSSSSTTEALGSTPSLTEPCSTSSSVPSSSIEISTSTSNPTPAKG